MKIPSTFSSVPARFLCRTACWTASALFPLAAAEDPIPEAELRSRIASGQFESVIEAAAAGRIPDSKEGQFLAGLARDFGRARQAVAAGSAAIPQGKEMRVFQGKYYAIYPESFAYADAAEFAASLGARLAEPRSQEQQSFLESELVMALAAREGKIVIAYTGIRNQEPGDTKEWTYLSDGTPIDFTAWAEPPDGNSGAAIGMALFSDKGGKWLDVSDGARTDAFKTPLLEWVSIPQNPDDTAGIGRALTSPLTPVADFPPFDSLRDKAAAAIDSRAVAAAEKDFQALADGYRQALQREEASAMQRGNLQEVVACRNEARLAERLRDVADAALLESASAGEGKVAQLRATFLQKTDEIRDRQAETMRPILAAYGESLLGIEKQLTVEYRIADALAIRDLRNDLAGIVGGERREVRRPAEAGEPGEKAKAPAPGKREIELDIPDRKWPRDVYDPGKPGKLGGFGKVWPGNKDLDLSRAEGIDDFVKVALLREGWIGLRKDGTLISTVDSLNGQPGVWRMIPFPENGAFLFWDDDTITENASKNALTYNGEILPAGEVSWLSKGGLGVLATMKDGRVLFCGQVFTPEERAAIEKAFAEIKIHAGYRYGIWGAKLKGGVVAAVLADKARMEKEKAVRLPEIDEKSTRMLEVAAMKGSTAPPILMLEDGSLLNRTTSWFPKKIEVHPFPQNVDNRALKKVADWWFFAGSLVTLTETGRWHVQFEPEKKFETFARQLEAELDKRKLPIKQLATFSAAWENETWAALAIWIE